MAPLRNPSENLVLSILGIMAQYLGIECRSVVCRKKLTGTGPGMLHNTYFLNLLY